MNTRHAWVEIDLQAIRQNYRWLQQQAQSRTLAVLKADAYGHGAIAVARVLEPDADGFAVANVNEAIELRLAGIDNKILVLGGCHHREEWQAVQKYRLDSVIHQDWQIDCMAHQAGEQGVDVWLKLDTGMGRLGFQLQQTQGLIERLQKLPAVRQIRLMTHFANADEPEHRSVTEQLDAIAHLRSLGLELSLGNSAASLGVAQAQSDWNRTGIALYGCNPFSDPARKPRALQAAMHFKTHLMAINVRHKGEAIGYGSRWICSEDMPIGVAAVGYADGYLRQANDQTPVQVAGHNVNIAGRVSMDMITLDLRNAPQAKVGDSVTLWGKSLPVEQVATCADTIPYELLCHAGRMNRRIYLEQ